jgi:hypothetical protein
MFNLKNGVTRGLAIAAFVLGSAAVSQATLLDSVLLPGSLNTLEDTSREAYIDVNNDGVFGVGDVITGFVRVEDVLKAPPGSTTPTGTTTYVVFSQQVSAINNTTGVVDFVATTVNGLQLTQLVSPATGGSISSSAIVAVVTLPAGFGDLITTAPTDLTGNGTITLADYFARLSTGQLELSAGIVNTNPLGDFFQAQVVGGALPAAVLAGIPGCNATLPLTSECIDNLPSSITLANFVAGLSIIDNNTSFTFADDISAAGFTTATLAQLAITGGNATGASGEGPTGFDDASELGNFMQCDNGTVGQGNSPCGFIDNADLSVRPLVATPEPASMLLFGFGLLGLGVYGRKRSRKSE